MNKPDCPEHDDPEVSNACMFVDYENLFSYIEENATHKAPPSYVINELLNSAVQYVIQELLLSVTSPVAYADFTLINSGEPQIQQSLYLAGVEPRFVPASLQSNASEIQICIDVLELLKNQTDTPVIFLVTGDRLYLPLLKFCQQKRVQSLVITFQPPDLVHAGEHSELFIHADKFLEQPTQAYPGGERDRVGPSSVPRMAKLTPPPQRVAEITDEISFSALQIIDDFFGQYEEIYLTPLLRKLSEMLGGHDDPKSLVNKLKDAGAVWLEKRKGYPYNYTVLLINYDHPTVMAIRAAAEEENYDDEVEYNHIREDESSLQHYDR